MFALRTCCIIKELLLGLIEAHFCDSIVCMGAYIIYCAHTAYWGLKCLFAIQVRYLFWLWTWAWKHSTVNIAFTITVQQYTIVSIPGSCTSLVVLLTSVIGRVIIIAYLTFRIVHIQMIGWSDHTWEQRMAFSRQLRLLLWKNYKLRVRQPVSCNEINTCNVIYTMRSTVALYHWVGMALDALPHSCMGQAGSRVAESDAWMYVIFLSL
jgi:hypothetical protein